MSKQQEFEMPDTITEACEIVFRGQDKTKEITMQIGKTPTGLVVGVNVGDEGPEIHKDTLYSGMMAAFMKMLESLGSPDADDLMGILERRGNKSDRPPGM